MAELKSIETDLPTIDLKTLSNIKDFGIVYHKDIDTLFFRGAERRPAASIDWNGEIWIRIDPISGEVVGMEIEDFEAVFLKKHPEIAVAWYESRPAGRRFMGIRRPKDSEKVVSEPFGRIVVNFLMVFFHSTPFQVGLSL